jgi:hypothetical protein
VALIPPQPGHGIPVIVLKGQPIGIGICSQNRSTMNTNPNVAITAKNDL